MFNLAEPSVAPVPGEQLPRPRREKNIVCAGCGCLCDDIELSIDGERIVEIANACALGEDWFRSESVGVESARPPCFVAGESVDFARAVERSAALLAESRAPLIFGLTQTTIETARAAVELADKIGAVIDADIAGGSAARIQAFQRQGRVTATLGEVKNRADVVLFWGVDPVTTHPRHAERYSIDAAGRFRANGRADRTILAVDERETPTARRADFCVELAAEHEIEATWTMRAILAGKPLDAGRVQRATGRPFDTWKAIVDRLKQAEYGVIFADSMFGSGRRSSSAFEAMTSFVRELNQVTRCVLLPLGGPGNAAGAESVLSWQTGFPNGVDLGAGFPASIPGVTSARERLTRGEADLALIVADPLPVDLTASALDHLKAIPSIVIAPANVDYGFEPTVRFSHGNPLLSSVGSVLRCDGVPLPLRAPLTVNAPSDRDCVRAISSKLDEPGHSLLMRV